MDEGDYGARAEAEFLKHSIAEALPERDGAVSMLECVECGEEIQEARRLAQKGCILCVECKTRFERNGRR